MRHTVLVVTNQEDLHASAVIAHLHEMGVRVFRLNTENLLTGHTLSLSQTQWTVNQPVLAKIAQLSQTVAPGLHDAVVQLREHLAQGQLGQLNFRQWMASFYR